MATNYQVQYLDSDNNLVETIMVSNSSIEVEKTVSEMGGDVLSVLEKKSSSFNIQLGDPVKLQEKTNFIQQLKTMLSSGVSLVKSLEIALKQINNDTFRNTIEIVINDIKQGNSFSDALKKHPKIFDKISIAMVEAGEKGGILDKMLEELEKSMNKG